MSAPEPPPPKLNLRVVRLLLWALVLTALFCGAALYVLQHAQTRSPQASAGPVKGSFGGPFTLVGADGKAFSSEALTGKPYALYFGFTRCGDVCPTTLARLVKLRRQAASDEAMRIVFITIDPAHDGAKEVGQYASLFGAPIIALTGSEAEITDVKKRYGMYAESVPDAPMGKQRTHTATVLLFDRTGALAGTISPDDTDAGALSKIRALLS